MADITIFGFTIYSVCDMWCDSKIISLAKDFRFINFSDDEVPFLVFHTYDMSTIFKKESIAQQYFHYSRNLSTYPVYTFF